MQAHLISGVVMDIAAFKVSHSAGVDIDATALQAKSGARNVPWGRWNVTAWVRFAGKLTQPATDTHSNRSAYQWGDG